MNRRQFICSAAAAAGVAAIPAAAIVTQPPVQPILPAWVVGTGGENDGRIIRALTQTDAIKLALEEETGTTECSCAEVAEKWGKGPCDYCWKLGQWEVWRAEGLDGITHPTGADWVNAGFGYPCERCDYDTHSDNGWVVNGEVVCEDCMTLADWDAIDPERAAEILADEAARPDHECSAVGTQLARRALDAAFRAAAGQEPDPFNAPAARTQPETQEPTNEKASIGHYGEWCRDPSACKGKGYCPKDPTCAD